MALGGMLGGLMREASDLATSRQEDKEAKQQQVMDLMGQGFVPTKDSAYSPEGTQARQQRQAKGFTGALQRTFGEAPDVLASEFTPGPTHPASIAEEERNLAWKMQEEDLKTQKAINEATNAAKTSMPDKNADAQLKLIREQMNGKFGPVYENYLRRRQDDNHWRDRVKLMREMEMHKRVGGLEKTLLPVLLQEWMGMEMVASGLRDRIRPIRSGTYGLRGESRGTGKSYGKGKGGLRDVGQIMASVDWLKTQRSELVSKMLDDYGSTFWSPEAWFTDTQEMEEVLVRKYPKLKTELQYIDSTIKDAEYTMKYIMEGEADKRGLTNFQILAYQLLGDDAINGSMSLAEVIKKLDPHGRDPHRDPPLKYEKRPTLVEWLNSFMMNQDAFPSHLSSGSVRPFNFFDQGVFDHAADQALQEEEDAQRKTVEELAKDAVSGTQNGNIPIVYSPNNVDAGANGTTSAPPKEGYSRWLGLSGNLDTDNVIINNDGQPLDNIDAEAEDRTDDVINNARIDYNGPTVQLDDVGRDVLSRYNISPNNDPRIILDKLESLHDSKVSQGAEAEIEAIGNTILFIEKQIESMPFALNPMRGPRKPLPMPIDFTPREQFGGTGNTFGDMTRHRNEIQGQILGNILDLMKAGVGEMPAFQKGIDHWRRPLD